MRKGGGKQKGAGFERSICKALSLWISEEERDDLLWRSAMSGGRATVKHKKGGKAEAHSGDISSTHWLGSYLTESFSIECKNYADLGFTPCVTKRKGALIAFWEQCIRDADINGKLPLMIAKQDRQPIVLVLSPEGMKLFQMENYPLLIPLARLYPLKKDSMIIYNFDEFIEQTDASVLEMIKLRKKIKRVKLCR